MEKGKKVVDLKEAKKDIKKLKVTNIMFELFNGNHLHSMAIMKLKMNLSGQSAYNLTRHITWIMESLDAKAYFNRKKEIVDSFNEAQQKLPNEKRVPALVNNIPELQDLLNRETELEIDRLKIDLLKIPEDMTNFLMDKLKKEKVSLQPNVQRVQMMEQQIEQERARLLNGFDMDILNLYFDLD